MHTEDEAKKLWCPHVRLTASEHIESEDLHGPSFNRLSDCAESEMRNVTACTCIASKCSQWRIAEHRWFYRVGLTENDERIYFNDPELAKEKDSYIADHKGYCGLAGKP